MIIEAKTLFPFFFLFSWRFVTPFVGGCCEYHSNQQIHGHESVCGEKSRKTPGYLGPRTNRHSQFCFV